MCVPADLWILRLFDTLDRVPVALFRDVVEVVERKLRKHLAEVLKTTSAEQRAA